MDQSINICTWLMAALTPLAETANVVGPPPEIGLALAEPKVGFAPNTAELKDRVSAALFNSGFTDWSNILMDLTAWR
jgi:hypothetical protein